MRAKCVFAANIVTKVWRGQNGKHSHYSHYNHDCFVLIFFCLQPSLVTSTMPHLPRLPVLPCFCESSSPSALPAADILGSLYLVGNSCDGNTHGTLKRKREPGVCHFKEFAVQMCHAVRWTKQYSKRVAAKANRATAFINVNQLNQFEDTWYFNRTTNHNQTEGSRARLGGIKDRTQQAREKAYILQPDHKLVQTDPILSNLRQ